MQQIVIALMMKMQCCRTGRICRWDEEGKHDDNDKDDDEDVPRNNDRKPMSFEKVKNDAWRTRKRDDTGLDANTTATAKIPSSQIINGHKKNVHVPGSC